MGNQVGVLRGWKSISIFLGCSVCTALRYLRERGLVVGYIGRTPVAPISYLERWVVMQEKGINPSKTGPRERDRVNQG